MTLGHLTLEIIECLAIVIAMIGLTYQVARLREHVEGTRDIPGLLERHVLRESDENEEVLVTQAVILRRLAAIERRMAHGTH
jgi:hypothetical protein